VQYYLRCHAYAMENDPSRQTGGPEISRLTAIGVVFPALIAAIFIALSVMGLWASSEGSPDHDRYYVRGFVAASVAAVLIVAPAAMSLASIVSSRPRQLHPWSVVALMALFYVGVAVLLVVFVQLFNSVIWPP